MHSWNDPQKDLLDSILEAKKTIRRQVGNAPIVLTREQAEAYRRYYDLSVGKEVDLASPLPPSLDDPQPDQPNTQPPHR